MQMVDYHKNKVYIIGGEYEDGSISNKILVFQRDINQFVGKGDEYKDLIKEEKWEEVGQLQYPRSNCEVVLNNMSLFILGGVSQGGKQTTAIEIFNVITHEMKRAEFRLPLGISGAALAYHGEDILLIGGNRLQMPSKSVMKLDFNDKTILSLKDLGRARENMIVLPVAVDEVIVCCGGGNRDAEIRKWDNKICDYVWRPVKIEGLGIFEKPDEFSTCMPTFTTVGGEDDTFPPLDQSSRFILGNELSPFLMEIPGSLVPSFYPAPMRIQQKTGQQAFRLDPNTIIFISGTNSTHKLFSRKSYKLHVKEKEIEQLGYMAYGRYKFTITKHEVNFFLLFFFIKTQIINIFL